MNDDPFNARRNFLDSIVATKSPSTYLPEIASGSTIFGNFMTSGTKSISDERRTQSLRILNRAAVNIPLPLTDIYDQEGFSRVVGAQLVKDLINGQYMMVYQYHPSRRGGAIKIPRVMDLGWLELKRFGKEPIEQILGGEWEHNQCGCVTGAIGRRHKYRDSYEVPIGPEKNLRIDVVLEAINKTRLYCQCCFSSAEREIEAAVKALSVIPAEAGRVILICKDKAISNAISKTLKKEPDYKKFQERISIKLFGDLLEYYHKKKKGDLL